MPWPRILTSDEQQMVRPQQGRMEQVVVDSSGMVEAGWAWYGRNLGLVAWAFRNADSSQRSVILTRNSFFFGDGYWPIYAANPGFRTSFLDGASPLVPLAEVSVPRNTAPLAPVKFGPGQSVVCFVFTLSPGQAWAMLETGYSKAPPRGLSVYGVAPASSGEFCLGYDPRAVSDWDDQTRTHFSGYSPNPSTYYTWMFQAESPAPYKRLFPRDSIEAGRCPDVPTPTAPTTPQVPTEPKGQTGGMFPPVFPDVLVPPINP